MSIRDDKLPEISENAFAANVGRAQRVARAFQVTEPLQAALLIRRTRTALTKAIQRAHDAQNDAALPALTSAIATVVELGFRLCQVPTPPRGMARNGKDAKPVMDIKPPE